MPEALTPRRARESPARPIALAKRQAPLAHSWQSLVTPRTAAGAPGQKCAPFGARTTFTGVSVASWPPVQGSSGRHGSVWVQRPPMVTKAPTSM